MAYKVKPSIRQADELHYLYQTIQKIHLIYVKHVLMSAQLRDYTISE